MLSKSHPIILFIDRFGFSVYQDTLTNIPKFNFTPDLVSNFDVVNKEQFVSLIATFIQINKIVGSSLAVILSDDVIYIKDLASPAQKPPSAQVLKENQDVDRENKDEVQSFLENIPFEDVLAKVIKTGNINRVVAVNKDLVMAIINAFENKGATIEAIVPSFIFGQNANFTAGLTSSNLRIILEDVETLKLGNLLTNQEKIIPFQNIESELISPPANGTKKPRNLRQYILIGAFVVLLVILAIVYLNSRIPPSPSPNPKVKNTSVGTTIAPTITPTAVLTAMPTSAQTLITTAPVDIKNIKVKITQGSQTDRKADLVKNELLGLGFTDITNEVSEISTPEKSSVAFSQNIPADLRNTIITEIRKTLPDASILESQDVDFTINILVGKS